MTSPVRILRAGVLLGALVCLACKGDDGGDDEAAATDDTTESSSSDSGENESSESESSESESESESTDATDEAESTDTSDTTDATDTTDTTDTADTTDTTDTDGELVMCPGVFPSFSKTCSTADECAIVFHTTDCCGNSSALGIHESEVADFEAAEAICDSQYPACGCPAGPPVAEDGNQAFDPDQLAVDCIDGQCFTFVP